MQLVGVHRVSVPAQALGLPSPCPRPALAQPTPCPHPAHALPMPCPWLDYPLPTARLYPADRVPVPRPCPAYVLPSASVPRMLRGPLQASQPSAPHTDHPGSSKLDTPGCVSPIPLSEVMSLGNPDTHCPSRIGLVPCPGVPASLHGPCWVEIVILGFLHSTGQGWVGSQDQWTPEKLNPAGFYLVRREQCLTTESPTF